MTNNHDFYEKDSSMSVDDIDLLRGRTGCWESVGSSIDIRAGILKYILNQVEDGIVEHCWISTDKHAICTMKQGYDYEYIDARIKLFLLLIDEEYDWIGFMLKIGKEDFIRLLAELKRLPGPVLMPSSRLYIDLLMDDAEKVSSNIMSIEEHH